MSFTLDPAAGEKAAIVGGMLSRVAETILDLLSNRKVDIPPTYFHYPKKGFIGELAKSLYDEALEYGLIHFKESFVYEELLKKRILKIGNKKITSNKIFYVNPFNKLIDGNNQIHIKQCKRFDAWSVLLFFAKIDKNAISENFSCIYFPEESTLPYRVRLQPCLSNEDNTNAKLIFEMNPDFLEDRGFEDNEVIINHIYKDLVKHSILKEGYNLKLIKDFKLKDCIAFPNPKNLATVKEQQKMASLLFPDINFPSLEGNFSDTFNDQIIKGLIIGNN